MIQLGSATGPQLAGYAQIEPPPPDTATVQRGASGRSAINLAWSVLGGAVAVVLVLASTSR